MSSIDKCRPHFLGLTGKRYGYIPEMFCETDLADHPWVDQYAGHSILWPGDHLWCAERTRGYQTSFLYSRENQFEDKQAD